MRPAVTTYAKEISDKLQYLVTWPVVTPIRLGAIGTLDDSVFDPIGDVANFGIGGAVNAGTAQADIVYTSNETKAGAVDFGAAVPNLAAGAAGVGGTASVKFSFSNSYGVILRMSGVTISLVADQIALTNSVFELWKRGAWNPEWFVVTEIAQAQATSVFISGVGQSSFELSIAAEAAPAGLDVLSANLSPSLTSQAGMDTVILNANGAVPLIRAKRLKKSLWQGVKATLIPGAAGEDRPEVKVLAKDAFDDISSLDDE